MRGHRESLPGHEIDDRIASRGKRENGEIWKRLIEEKYTMEKVNLRYLELIEKIFGVS